MLENSKIIISKNIKVDRELKNVLSYNPTQLLNLMSNETHLVASDNHYSFIRERNTLQVDIEYSKILNSNYLAYQNTDYSNKWFFAWIDEVIYKGDKNTEIVFTVDPFETFYSDLTFENSYVIREHVNDDTIGANTIPEDIDTGDMTIESAGQITELSQANFVIAMETDATPNTGSYSYTSGDPGITKFSGVTVYNKIYSGHRIIIFTSRQDLSRFIYRLNEDDAVDFIKNLFIIPSALFDISSLGNDYAYTDRHSPVDTSFTPTERFDWYLIPMSNDIKIINGDISKNRTITGYAPKNNKCYCYPYNYLLVSNNVGNTKIYKYEDFSNSSNCEFDVVGALTLGGSFKLIPKNYQGISANYDESIALAKYPTVSWTSDAYTNWLTQQAVNEISGSSVNILQGAIAGASTGGGYGAVIGGGISAVGEVLGFFDKMNEAKLQPNIQGGSNTGDINWAIRRK